MPFSGDDDWSIEIQSHVSEMENAVYRAVLYTDQETHQQHGVLVVTAAVLPMMQAILVYSGVQEQLMAQQEQWY